jgi:hypothetical protein
VLGEWKALNGKVETKVTAVMLMKGDTLDFVVDPLGNESFDAFAWAPVVRTLLGDKVWDAAKGFGPPPPPPISRVALYAQALMMTNEFLFVD